MATLTRERTRVAYTISGNSPEIRQAPEGASQTYGEGAFLFLSASSRLRALPTASISRADVAKGIAGMALADGASRTNSTTMIRFTVANPDTVFIGNIASRQSTATATLAYVQLGSVFGASINASTVFPNVKSVAATNSLLIVKGFFEDDAIGDTYGRVYFQFLRNACAFGR